MKDRSGNSELAELRREVERLRTVNTQLSLENEDNSKLKHEVERLRSYNRQLSAENADLSLLREAFESVEGVSDISVSVKYYIRGRRGHFAYVNRRKAQNNGTTQNEMVNGKTDFDYLPREQAEKIKREDLLVFKKGQCIIDRAEPLTRPDGSVVWVSVSKFPWIFKGRTLGVVSFSRNITKRKDVERQWLDAMTQAMHDLRNKVMTGIGVIDLRCEIKVEAMQEKLRELREINASLESILRGNMDRLNSLDSNAFYYIREYDLRSDIIDLSIKDLDYLIKKNKVTIDDRLGLITGGEISVLADKLRFRTVYYNLFENAIKYGASVISYGREDRGDYYELNVWGNSPIISDQVLATIFIKWKDPKDRHPDSGFGIGMYGVKKIIEAHGGRIRIDQSSGHPNFIFTLMKPKAK
jgi:PAS domain S-box-containing protein